MAKQSGMMAFAEHYAQRKLAAAQLLIIQYMNDTLQIAIHRLTEAWAAVRKEYSPVMDTNDPASDVYREHMDRVMREIIGKKQELIPFEERYPELKKVKYK